MKEQQFGAAYATSDSAAQNDTARVAAESEAALEALSQEVMLDPNRCFCRNCGKPVLKAASVCVNCNYVLNPAALQHGVNLVTARRQKYERGHKVFSVIAALTGIDLENPQRAAVYQTPNHQQYMFQPSGHVYCTNCGKEVDPGASVCVHCNYVLNSAAYSRARLAVEDKQAKLSAKEFFKSLLIPFHGWNQRKIWLKRRPQVAKPCGILGWINAALIVGAVVAAVILL